MFLRDLVTLIILLSLAISFVYAYSFHRRCARLEARLVAVEVAQAAHQKDYEAQQQVTGAELSQLELAVFGRQSPPPPSVPNAADLIWQRNRDRWFNNRLNALERWRLERDSRGDK